MLMRHTKTMAFALSLFLSSALKAEEVPLSAYGNLPQVEDVALSYTGKNVAYVVTDKGERKLLVVDANGNVLLSAAVGDSKFRGISWAGDDILTYTISKTHDLGADFISDKAELYSTIVLNFNGKIEPKSVFQAQRSLANATFGNFGTRLVNGKWVGYYGALKLEGGIGSTGGIIHGRPYLHAVSFDDMKAKLVAQSASVDRQKDWLVDSAGEVAATFDISTENGQWKILNAKDQKIAEGKDITGDVGMIALSADGTKLIYASEDEEGTENWFELPLAGGASTPFLADKSIRRSYIDKYTGRMIGYLEDGANPKPVMFLPADQKIMNAIYKAFPNVTPAVAEWTPGFAQVLVHTSGSNDSGTWYLVDRERKTAAALAYDYSQIAPEHVGPVSEVKYTASDGLEMDGILTLPPGKVAKNLPLIMMPHGGPHAHDRIGFDWWAQAYASRGYAVFQPNFRGSTGRGDAFRRAGYGEWGRKMQTDLSDGLAELVKQGIADPKRVCIVGASYGGYAALAGVTLQKGIYRCAVAVAPVSDLAEMRNTDIAESGDSRMMKEALKESLGDPKTFAQVSPRKFARNADAPILLIHGKDDVVVPFKQSTEMAGELKKHGKPYEFITLKEEDHWMSRGSTRLQMLEASVAFVEKYNPTK